MKKTQVSYRVPYADTDKMGVVYYANYLVYFERVRNEILREIHYSYQEMESDGLILPVVEAHCDYGLSAKYDDMLDIFGWLGEGKGCRIKVFCEVKRENVLLVTGYTVHACLSSETNRPVRLPPKITSHAS